METIKKELMKVKFDNGTFNLRGAFNDDAKEYLKSKKVNINDVTTYLEKTFFPIVSLILQRATYGQHRLNRIKITTESSLGVDILITKYNTNVFGRIWNKGQLEFSINHIYSPGLMLHELGHYLYHLGDEYEGCRKKRWEPKTPKTPEIKADPASIMEYSFGNNTRFKRKGQDKEYKVLEGGGFDEFWKDYINETGKLGEGIGKKLNLIYKRGKVVTDFCHHSIPTMKHDPIPRTEQNIIHEDKSCWSVMTDIYSKYRGAGLEYFLEDPFENNLPPFEIESDLNDIL